MNLQELQEKVNNAVEVANELEMPLTDIPVSIQIDDVADPHHGYIQTDEDVELTYDNNATASGCVIHGWRNTNDES